MRSNLTCFPFARKHQEVSTATSRVPSTYTWGVLSLLSLTGSRATCSFFSPVLCLAEMRYLIAILCVGQRLQYCQTLTVLTFNSCTERTDSRAYNVTARSVATQFPGHGCMDDLSTERIFDSQAARRPSCTCIFYLLSTRLNQTFSNVRYGSPVNIHPFTDIVNPKQ